MDIVAFIFEVVVPLIFLFVFLMFSYVGIHMAFESDAKKRLPLAWEEGGILHNLIFGKSK